MPLANIQKTFVNNLLRPQVNESEFLAELLPLDSLRSRLSEEKQLSIYKSNINGAHQKVLGQIYPACLNILGEDYFNQLCRVYRFEYPSTDPNLNSYGEYFSVFINEQSELHAELNDFEYLAELALLEWNWHASFYAENDNVFAFEELAKVDTEDQNKLVFILSHSFSLYSTEFPLQEIWNANNSDTEGNQEFHMPESENHFCISRIEFSPRITLLNNYQYNLLKSISNGLSLTQLTELDYIATGDFQSELMSFIQNGWVTDFSLESRD